ncbi:hypothetical protein FN846DRAFT_902827 [Sphaerosporella brunnea]|uniref:Uncharacterized protein n=1 Tax=Sphaerosporella brunnea TaxID=1250544 RepID=A0A5J5F992_9PEZI|nr:hypothetical protein FN846DRAFT_902827 [Sphaerosporella brunnea]
MPRCTLHCPGLPRRAPSRPHVHSTIYLGSWSDEIGRGKATIEAFPTKLKMLRLRTERHTTHAAATPTTPATPATPATSSPVPALPNINFWGFPGALPQAITHLGPVAVQQAAGVVERGSSPVRMMEDEAPDDLVDEYIEWFITRRGRKEARVAAIKEAGGVLAEQFFDLPAIYKLKADEWERLGAVMHTRPRDETENDQDTSRSVETA